MAEKKPEREIRLGRIRSAIWSNEDDDGETWFNVTLGRRYKDDGQWREASSFSRDDLPVAMQALNMAYSWIWNKQLASSRNEED
jgi:hypothetical protein